MKQLVINIKDERKLAFLLELLSQLDFVELETKFFRKEKVSTSNDFFTSAGLFAGRDIDADQLRKQAWRITS